jgi:hypothetical protein
MGPGENRSHLLAGGGLRNRSGLDTLRLPRAPAASVSSVAAARGCAAAVGSTGVAPAAIISVQWRLPSLLWRFTEAADQRVSRGREVHTTTATRMEVRHSPRRYRGAVAQSARNDARRGVGPGSERKGCETFQTSAKIQKSVTAGEERSEPYETKNKDQPPNLCFPYEQTSTSYKVSSMKGAMRYQVVSKGVLQI